MGNVEEIWKPIEGFNGNYEISNLGRVKSLRGPEDRIMKPTLNRRENGYYIISLAKRGKQIYKTIHRLVAEAFVPNPDGLTEINHIDENKLNNCADNLEWCDRKYNMNHISKSRRRVLQYSIDGEFIKEWKSARECERELGIFHTAISNVCNGNRKTAGGYVWKYKSEQIS